MLLAPLRARAKMSLSRGKNKFTPANINSIVIIFFWHFSRTTCICLLHGPDKYAEQPSMCRTSIQATIYDTSGRSNFPLDLEIFFFLTSEMIFRIFWLSGVN